MKSKNKHSWVLTEVSLVIKGRHLQPEEVTPFLDLEPSGTRTPGPSKWDRPGELDGQWRVTHDERISRDFHQQLDGILSIVERKQTELSQLVEQGHEVTVNLFGFAGHDTTLELQPEEVVRIARLGFPLKVAANMNER